MEQVPVGRATNGIVDDNYLRTEPGIVSDLLRDVKRWKRNRVAETMEKPLD